MFKSRASYNFRIIEDKKILSIVDNDQGMSVTNDIENVIQDIKTISQEKLEGYKVIYQDTDGIWDGWDMIKNGFIPLQAETEDEAIEKILSK